MGIDVIEWSYLTTVTDALPGGTTTYSGSSFSGFSNQYGISFVSETSSSSISSYQDQFETVVNYYSESGFTITGGTSNNRGGGTFLSGLTYSLNGSASFATTSSSNTATSSSPGTSPPFTFSSFHSSSNKTPLPTYMVYTTTSATYEQDYGLSGTTTTSTFTSYGITSTTVASYTEADTGGTSIITVPSTTSIATYSFIYTDVSTTSFSTSLTTYSLVSAHTTQSYYGNVTVLNSLCEEGETIFFSTGSNTLAVPMTALVTTNSYSYIDALRLSFVHVAPSSVSSRSTVFTSTYSTSTAIASSSSFLSTFSISNFGEGGLQTFVAGGFSQFSTSISTTGYGVHSTSTSTTGSTYYFTLTSIISTTVSGSSTGVLADNNGLYSTYQDNFPFSAYTSITSTIYTNVGPTSSSAYASSSGSSTSFSTVGFTGNTIAGSGATGYTVVRTLDTGYWFNTVGGASSITVMGRVPNMGFRLTPDDTNLAAEIGLGFSTFSMASDAGGYVFSQDQTVPIQYPGQISWVDSSSRSFFASWSSISLSVTESFSGTAVSSGSAVTTYSSTSSALTWTSASPVTETLFSYQVGAYMGAGTGRGEDDTRPMTIILPPGGYSFKTYTTYFSAYTSLSVSSEETVRGLPFAIPDINFGARYAIEEYSEYNR